MDEELKAYLDGKFTAVRSELKEYINGKFSEVRSEIEATETRLLTEFWN